VHITAIKHYILTHTILPKVLVGFLTLFIALEWGYAVRDVRRLDAQNTQMNKALQVKPVPVLKPVIKHAAVDAMLFGAYVPDDVDDAGVERSSLNISVIGIMYSSDARESQVMLDVSGEEKSFHVGDKIPGGAVIKRITPGGVLLLRGGKVESLSLPQHELHFAPQPKPLTQ
jgi:general secretion pathway protein C